MMESDSQRSDETARSQVSEEVGAPVQIEHFVDRKERVYVSGCEVVASGSVLMRRHDTVAIYPFYKSKTGTSVEFSLYFSGATWPGDPNIKAQQVGEVTRWVFVDCTKPAGFTIKAMIYRGRQVMARVSLTAVRPEHTESWHMLNYTMFYANTSEPKSWR